MIDGEAVEHVARDPRETEGVNTRIELAAAAAVLGVYALQRHRAARLALSVLAVPILAAFKIFCSHIEPMEPLAEFMS